MHASNSARQGAQTDVRHVRLCDSDGTHFLTYLRTEDNCYCSERKQGPIEIVLLLLRKAGRHKHAGGFCRDSTDSR
jgi:hypothetical protein